MEDIHTPSVVSGPTTNDGLAGKGASVTLSLGDLISQREKVESELKALSSVLDSVSHRPTGSSGYRL